MKQTTICALCAALLLAGCGGGGGSSASAPSLVPAPNIDNAAGLAGDDQNFANSLKAQAATLDDSKAASTSGGVTQSTNVGFEGVTQDIVNVSISGPANNPNYVVSYDATGNGSDEFSINTSALSTTQFWSRIGIDTFGGVTATTQVGVIRWAPVDKDGNGNNDGKLYLGMRTDSYTAAGDTDYTVAGYWLYAPTNLNPSPSDYDMGAFFDMPEEHVFKNINMAQGQASYAGELDGFYMGDSNHPIVSDLYAGVGTIGGNVALNANFNTNKISGSITGFSSSGILAYQPYNGAIQLAETDITSQNNGAGNFFSGVASGALDNCYVITSCTNTIPQGDDYFAVSAHWGGMFYGGDGANGDQPAGVGGTISGAGIQEWEDNGQQFATYLYFVGYFGATKQ